MCFINVLKMDKMKHRRCKIRIETYVIYMCVCMYVCTCEVKLNKIFVILFRLDFGGGFIVVLYMRVCVFLHDFCSLWCGG